MRGGREAQDQALLNRQRRSKRFTNRAHNRFWWHDIESNDYVPALYKTLSTREWATMAAWCDDTAWHGRIGEINVPARSLMQGLISGSGVRRTAELGSYHGYATLLTGFMLRSQGNGGHMVSIDLDPVAVEFVEKLGGMPELILRDSPHQYSITLKELDLWVERMEPGTIMLLHDTSTFARDFDPPGEGGVQRA